MKEKIIKAYAQLAKDYEKHVDTEGIANAYYERPAMMQLLPPSLEGMTVLDAGCAAGWYTEQLISLGADVKALDISPEMVEATKRRVGDKATVLQHDLNEALPFQNRSFDMIISSLTLHYLADWEPLFQEFHRVLKPWGQLLFSVHHPFMDFTAFNRPNYFQQEMLVDVWNKQEAGRVEVTFYRRPLQAIINTTTMHFTLKQLIEPQPIKAFIERYPDSQKSYEQFYNNPHFLIVQASK